MLRFVAILGRSGKFIRCVTVWISSSWSFRLFFVLQRWLPI